MPKGVRIPDDVQEEIAAMARQGMRASDIAAETDININTVFRILERQGVPALPVEQPKLGRGQVPNETIQQVVERYINKENVADICSAAEISISHMYEILREAGVKTHQESGASQRAQSMNDAITMYQKKVPIYEITQATGVSGYALNIELHKRGVPLRRPRRANMETVDLLD